MARGWNWGTLGKLFLIFRIISNYGFTLEERTKNEGKVQHGSEGTVQGFAIFIEKGKSKAVDCRHWIIRIVSIASRSFQAIVQSKVGRRYRLLAQSNHN